MSANGTTDLDNILATLARLAPPPQTSQSPAVESWIPSRSSSSQLEAAFCANGAHNRRPNPAETPRPTVDPASITIWSEGLRCVTKLAQQNSQFAATIQKIMRDQKANEMRWYSERQNLKQTQANRATSAARAQSLLKSLQPGPVSTTAATTTNSEADHAAELAQFDRKIYAAQLVMENTMCADLKGLGVPFCGTDSNLVVPNGYDVTSEPLPDDHPRWSPLVTECQLLELRRRMMQHLVDLYRE